MTIGSLYIKPLGVILMFVPFVLAFVAIWLRSARVNKDTAGFISNASSIGYWLFIITALSVIVSLIAGLFDPHLSIFSKSGLWFLVLLSFLFFLCYYVISFKPVNAEQLEEARDEGCPLFETAGLAAAGVAGGLSVIIKSTMKMLARAPIDIVWQSGNTIWYRKANVGGFLGGVAAAILPAIAIGVLLSFAAMFFLLVIVIISWLLVVIKFIRNMVYLKGPRS